MDPLTTGIVAADAERLILRPFLLPFRRRELLRIGGGVLLVGLLAGAVFFALFRRHVDPLAVLAAAVAGAGVMAYRVSTQVTFIALRGGDGIYVETRNRILRTTRRRLLHRYADIDGVELRSRVNPNALKPGLSPTGAYLHYDVVLRKGQHAALFWYTRYPECAEQIAAAIAAFANVSVRDAR